VGPRAGLDRCGKSRPYRDSIPGSSSQLQVAIPTELPRSLEVQGHTLQKTLYVSNTKSWWLILFQEIIVVYM